jgi:UDP-N-acetylmuramoyl-tripeptide--D-alanyl-D-alanine ligase
VLGEMGELGADSAAYHAELAPPVIAAGVDVAILVGAGMKPLAIALEGQVEFVHVPDAEAALAHLKTVLSAGDAVLIKGSNSVGLAAVVAALGGKRP